MTMTGERYQELRRLLKGRHDEIADEVQHKIRSVWTEGGAKTNERGTVSEAAEADIQDDIEFALMQMKTETLNKIRDALTRLEEGAYGYCYECGEEIAKRRLRAQPFAARCKNCQEVNERRQHRERVIEARSKAVALFS